MGSTVPTRLISSTAFDWSILYTETCLTRAIGAPNVQEPPIDVFVLLLYVSASCTEGL